MAITKQKKSELVSSMKERLANAKSIVFVNFKALSASETKILRRKLSADKVGYFVSKKTLAKRVLGDLNAKGNMPELPGELAIAYGDDLLAPARETYAFQKTAREKGSISIVGGIFDGEFKTQAEMMSIATIPPLQVLRGMFLNVINSPIQRFAIALGQIAESKDSRLGREQISAAPVAKAEVVVAPVEAVVPKALAETESSDASAEIDVPAETVGEAPTETETVA